MATFRGIYINLDRSPERWAVVEQTLRELGLSSAYSRLSATDGAFAASPARRISPAAFGCFHSHMRALDLARQADCSVHVMEDDAAPSCHLAPFMGLLAASRILDRFDVVFLDMWVDPKEEVVRGLQAAFAAAMPAPGAAFDVRRVQLVDMRHLRLGSTASYVVTPAGADRLFRLLRAALDVGPDMPVDAFCDRLVREGRLRAAVTMPFLTGTDVEQGAQSLIQTEITADYTRLMLLLRRSLFVDRDPSAIRAALATLLQRNMGDATFHHAFRAIDRGLSAVPAG